MQYTYEMMKLRKLYPDLSFAEMEAICKYWHAFYSDPIKYNNVESIVFDWLRNGDGKEIVQKYIDSMGV